MLKSEPLKRKVIIRKEFFLNDLTIMVLTLKNKDIKTLSI